MKEKFIVIRDSQGIAIGVGMQDENGVIQKRRICTTFQITSNNKQDVDESEKWANMVCDLLNHHSPIID